VDLRESFADSTRQMLRANDLEGENAEIVVCDIFDLDEEFWRRHDPDVVLLLEMLEHVDDPGRALRAVAGAVKVGTQIILTVPMFGHLDQVWGHRSAFDRKRLMRLCRAAGLAVERAEALGSVWSLVVARTGPLPADAESVSEPGYSFERVAVPEPVDGAVRLEMPAPRAVRLELEGADAVRVRGLDEAGRVRLEWAGPLPGGRSTSVLRPGKGDGAIEAVRSGKADCVRWIEVNAEPVGGVHRARNVRRAAFLGTLP